jgi:hypothetical protein
MTSLILSSLYFAISNLLSFISATSWTKSGSTNQQRVPGDNKGQDFFLLKPDNKFAFVKDMKKSQAVVFKGPELWHGSPVLEHPLNGERDALVITVVLKRTKEVVGAN